MKDTYLTSEDELFYLITLMLVGDDVLDFPLGWCSLRWKAFIQWKRFLPFDEDDLLLPWDDILLGKGNDPFFYNL